jgi:oxidase EvaA
MDKNAMKDGLSASYREGLRGFREACAAWAPDVETANNEMQFESLRDWTSFHSLQDVEEWFESERQNCPMKIRDIPLNECRNWKTNSDTGEITHESGEFFKIQGIRITQSMGREVGELGWDQPILTQIGFDGGLLGIIRRRFDGIPHYLIEAKAEPGNYEKVQISPTLQATFSNLRKAHNGRKPRFADIFENPDPACMKVLFDEWLSEDGGRLHLKRNRGMLIEIDESYNLGPLPANFRWLSLYQIQTLLKKDAWVGPHVRGILAYF